MRPTASNVIRWAGLAAIVAGILFVAVGILHEPKVPSSATTTQWALTHSFATATCFLALLGLTGLYARQVEAAGWLGLVGFLLFSLNWALTACFTVAEVFVLPMLAAEAPTVAEGFLRIFNSSLGGTNFGALAALWDVTGILYIAGGVLFGLATSVPASCSAGRPVCLSSRPRWPQWRHCFRSSTSRLWRYRWG